MFFLLQVHGAWESPVRSEGDVRRGVEWGRPAGMSRKAGKWTDFLIVSRRRWDRMVAHPNFPATIMKRIVRRVQSLNERAAELTAAAGQLPNRMAELRSAVTATTGQLQHLKSDIQLNVADLQVSREDDLSEALAVVVAHAPVLAEAGYVLDGLDVEISPVQRLIVQLVCHRHVGIPVIQGLVQRHEQQRSVRAILSAILKARAMVETVDIEGLDFHKLMIGIGPVPTIRLCWRDRVTDVDDLRPLDNMRPAGADTSGVQTSFFGAPPVFAPLAQPPAVAVEPAGHEPPAETEFEDGVAEDVAFDEADEAPVAEETVRTFTTHSPPPPLPVVQAAPPSPPARPKPPPLPSDDADPLARFKVMPRL